MAHRVISAERQVTVENIVLNIDNVDDVAQLASQLASLLAPAVHSPLD